MRAAIYITTLLVAPLLAGTPEAMVLLKANCFSCHNPEKEKGGLDLTSREAILAGGDNGKVAARQGRGQSVGANLAAGR